MIDNVRSIILQKLDCLCSSKIIQVYQSQTNLIFNSIKKITVQNYYILVTEKNVVFVYSLPKKTAKIINVVKVKEYKVESSKYSKPISNCKPCRTTNNLLD